MKLNCSGFPNCWKGKEYDMIHQLKAEKEHFEAVAEGIKTFEIRQNDRFFEVGDFLALNEVVREVDHRPEGDRHYAKETGRCLLVEIVYILHDPQYCKNGFVVLAIKPCAIRRMSGMNPEYDYCLGAVPVYGDKELVEKFKKCASAHINA